MKALLEGAFLATAVLGFFDWIYFDTPWTWYLYIWLVVAVTTILYMILGIGWNDRAKPWYTRYSVWDDRGNHSMFYVRKDDV